MLLGLRVGDPADEVLGAWLAKESVRDVYLADDPAEAALLLHKAIAGCADDEVEEVRSLGNTLARWRVEILAHHATGAANGPTEGLNLCVKKVKRLCGHGFRTFEHYRLRVLLHAGGVTWPSRPRPPRIRTATPYSDAQSRHTSAGGNQNACASSPLFPFSPTPWDAAIAVRPRPQCPTIFGTIVPRQRDRFNSKNTREGGEQADGTSREER